MKSSSSSSSSRSMPSIYKPSPMPSRIYRQNKPSEPQVIQTQQTLGESIKQGFGTLIGWNIGSLIFGNPHSHSHSETHSYIHTLPPPATTSIPNDKCFDYRELFEKCVRNGGDWNGNSDCSKFKELLEKCERENNNKPSLTFN